MKRGDPSRNVANAGSHAALKRISNSIRRHLGLALLFLLGLLLAIPLHLDLAVTKRLLHKTLTSYLDHELAGHIDFGRIERLDASSAWVTGAAIYDPSHRRVLTCERLRVRAHTFRILWDLLARSDKLTVVIDSVHAEGVHVRLLPVMGSPLPSLAAAFESDPATKKADPSKPTRPYRVALTEVNLGRLSVENQLDGIPLRTGQIARAQGLVLVTKDGVAVSVKRFGLSLSGDSNLSVSATSNLEFRTPDHLWGQMAGTIGKVAAVGRVEYKAGKLELHADVPQVMPDQARSLWLAWPLSVPATATLAAYGPLDQLATRLEVRSGRTRAEVSGVLQLKHHLDVSVALTAQHLDLAQLGHPGLTSDLPLKATLSARLDGNRLDAHAEGLVEGGTLAGHALPTTVFEAQSDDEGYLLSLRTRSREFPLRAGLWFRRGQLELDAQSGALNLAKLGPLIGMSKLEGTGLVRAHASVKDSSITANASASLSGLNYGAWSTHDATLTARWEGPTEQPSGWKGTLEGHVRELRSPYFAYNSLSASVHGTPDAFQVKLSGKDSRATELELSTHVTSRQGRYGLSGLVASLSRPPYRIALTADRAEVDEGRVSIKQARLRGNAGEATASFSCTRGGSVEIAASLERVDLATMGELAGLPSHQLTGTTSGSVELSASGTHSRGRSQLTFERVTAGPFTRVSGTWEQNLASSRLEGSLSMSSDLIDRIGGNYDVRLPGNLFSSTTWHDATGTVDVDLERFRLDRVGLLLGFLPNKISAQGTLSSRLHVSRMNPGISPNVELSVVSDGLAVAVENPFGTMSKLERAMLLGSVGYDGESRKWSSDWVLGQDQKPRVLLGMTTEFELASALEDWAAFRSRMYDLPFSAHLELPAQSLLELEPILGMPLGQGNVRGKVAVNGPLTNPRFAVEYQGTSLLLEPLRNVIPFDTQGILEFRAKTGEANWMGSLGSGPKTWAQLSAAGRVFNTSTEPNSESNSPYDWSGRVELGITDLPLGAVPGADKARLEGSLNGGVTVTRLSGQTQLTALLPITSLTVDARPVGQSLISLRSDSKSLELSAKLIDGGAQVDLEANIPAHLTTPIPTLRRDAAVHVAAQAKGYDAGILTPFVDSYVASLQGDLSFSLEATVRPNNDPTGGIDELSLGGNLTIAKGRGRLQKLGVRIEDVNLTAQASSTASRTLINISNLSAAVGATQANLKGRAVIELEKFDLKRLAAQLEHIDRVPLAVNGVNLAELTGSAHFEMSPHDSKSTKDAASVREYVIDAKISELDIRLPRAKSRKVVGLAENADIEVAEPLSQSQYQKTQTRTGTPIRLKIALGRKSKVIRSDFTLPITGSPVLVIGDQLSASGIIQLESTGRVQLFGKTFVIDRGRVTLDPDDPANPRFDVVALWRGPSHNVTATVSGTPKEAVLHLASDPPLPSESQVMALLISGSSGDSGTATAGLGVGATLFNEFMSETPLASVELRTSQDGQRANYTAAVPLKDNLWFEGTYQSSNSSGLRPNSSNAREGFSGTVDWRFRKNWSLRTEVGTLGAGADLLWQYRY